MREFHHESTRIRESAKSCRLAECTWDESLSMRQGMYCHSQLDWESIP